MAVEGNGRRDPFVIDCDVCHETQELLGNDFGEAIADAIGDGWFSIKRGADWRHYCSQRCARTED